MTGSDPIGRPDPRHWVVIGSGFVGTAVLHEVRAHGVVVSSSPAPRLTAPVGTVTEDLVHLARHDPGVASLAALFADVDCVVNAAGLAAPDAAMGPELLGANALLPGVVAAAAHEAGVRRVLHISSAAVQGRRDVLTESVDTAPFSPYSTSKAIGEEVFARTGGGTTESVVVRATSVQGAGRRTTAGLQRIARSPLASVARPGDQPAAVSSVEGLAAFVRRVGAWPEPVPTVLLQPWEGLSAAEVLRSAGGRQPRTLPRRLCRTAVRTGYALSTVLGGRWHGPVRRVEAMWFGQDVRAEWAERNGLAAELRDRSGARDLLAGAR